MKKLLALILLSTLTSVSYAAPQWCSGKVTQVWINETGNLYIYGDWINNHTMICNVNEAWNGVTPAVCNNWFSIVLAARLSNTNVKVHYADGYVDSCATIPAYAASPRPAYVMSHQ